MCVAPREGLGFGVDQSVNMLRNLSGIICSLTSGGMASPWGQIIGECQCWKRFEAGVSQTPIVDLTQNPLSAELYP